MASGKGTAAEYISKNYKAKIYRFSTALRDILERLYLEEIRGNMQKLSTVLRENFGQDILARVITQEVKNDLNEIVVVDGVRREADIKFLKELPEFKLVYIEADIEKRHERISKRGENKDDNAKTFEQFKKELSQESELQIKSLKNIADYVIDNSNDIGCLYAEIDKIIAECKARHPKGHN